MGLACDETTWTTSACNESLCLHYLFYFTGAWLACALVE